MSFWDDFAEGFTRTIKDIGTSVTRIVTDTAIDLGNVVTGFQFQDKMDEAKQTLKDAGLLNAADAIEKNYYSFLPVMRVQVENEHDELARLYPIAQNAERTRNDADRNLGKMLDNIKILALSSLEAENIFAEANKIPYWQEWSKLSDVPVDTLKNLKDSCAKWDVICQKILISRGVANVGDGVAATTSIIISRITKAAAVVVKDAELLETGEISVKTAEALEGVEVIGETAEIAATAGRLAKIGEIAGDASAILAVASIGLDIGLSVAQLEDQKATLKKNINDLTNGIALAKKDIADMAQETNQIHSQIQELLWSVTPPVEENNWDYWVKHQQDIITDDLTKLTSAKGIYERALKMAKAHPDRPYDERIEDVKSIDDSITEDQAKQIIAAAVETAPIAFIIGNYECHLYDNGGKNDWHYVTIREVSEGTFKWINRAGVSWILKTTFDKTKLEVGQDCPYYNFNDGTRQMQYRQATVVWAGSQVSGILGPWNELYEKSAP